MDQSKSSDEVWKQMIRQLLTSEELVTELALLYLEIGGVDDPYYTDFYEEICKKAVELRKGKYRRT